MSDDTWKSCCFIVNKRAVLFFSQLGISVGVIAFSLFMLLTYKHDCSTESTYIGLLTLILGVWLPSPKFERSLNISSPQRVPQADPVEPV